MLTKILRLAAALALLALPLSAEEMSEGARQFLAQQPPTLSQGSGAVSTAYGVSVTQQDIDLHMAVGTCDLKKGDATHPPDLSFWPELAVGAPANPPPGPCTTAHQMYEQSGAKAKYDRSDANLRSDQYQAVMKATGKR
jgi:hypothetical protein